MTKENSLEDKLRKQGFKYIIGIDESGRGPLAGPVIAVAVLKIKNYKLKIKNLGIEDSKKLSPRQRKEIYKVLKKYPQIVWGRGLVTAKVIDKINILEATKLAMRRAVQNLEKKLHKKLPRAKTVLIIDGNQKIGTGFFEIPVVKADETIFLCMCASIVAKVERDRLMEKYHKLFPVYGFDKHKGYPTKLHKKKLKKYGPCLIHRKSFRPLKIKN
ncbi:ribonuclease HII [bacterium]|nr:ribonuclease HII [bacterium]